MLAARTGRASKGDKSKDTASVDSRTLSHSLPSKEQEEQELSLALVRMEKAMQEHATGEAGEPDWENADWAWARTALRVKHSQSLTVVERSNLCRKLREDIRKSDQLISREELKSQTDVAMLRIVLEWRRSVLQREENSRAGIDESSVGITSLTLSLAGIQEAPGGRSTSDQIMLEEHRRMVIRWEYSRTISLNERTEIRRSVRSEHPGASESEIKAFYAERLMDKALEAHAKERLSSDLSERIKEDELLVRGPAQEALLKDHALSLAEGESAAMYAEFREANPDASAKEHVRALRAFRVQAELSWRKNREHGGRNSSLPLSGKVKLAEPLSIEAQSKSDSSTTVRYYLSLTKEERAPIRIATELANPDADAKALNKAYKIALWKADSLKKGINSGQNWEAVDYSPVSGAYSEDSDQESSASS
jgi:hypothetical protein